VYVPVAVGDSVAVPDAACVPLQAPEAEQLDAFLVDQVSEADPPRVMASGWIPIETVGRAGEEPHAAQDSAHATVTAMPVRRFSIVRPLVATARHN
jgi:hypothetical protein